MNPHQDYPVTAEYLKVRAWGERWNDLQRWKTQTYGIDEPFAEWLVTEASRMTDK